MKSRYLPQKRNHSSFQRDRLPRPEWYYQNQGLKLTGWGLWKSALCPFHQDKKPSLRIHIHIGCFRCMACGVHGGDVLAFHRRRYQLSFIEAARALGAWEDKR